MKFATLTLAALAAAGVLAGSAYAQQAEQPRTIGVNGQGEVRAEPDRATVALSVESRKPKLDDARAEVAKTVEAVLKLTRELKVDQTLVHATRINVQPEYNWQAQNNERTLIGYYVSRPGEAGSAAGARHRSRREPGRRPAAGFEQAPGPGARSACQGSSGRAAERRSHRQGRRREARRCAHDPSEHRVHAAADTDGSRDGDGSQSGGRAVSERRDDLQRHSQRSVRPDPAMRTA
jgi:hypothetical protein